MAQTSQGVHLHLMSSRHAPFRSEKFHKFPLDKIFPNLESDPAVTYHLLPCSSKSASTSVVKFPNAKGKRMIHRIERRARGARVHRKSFFFLRRVERAMSIVGHLELAGKDQNISKHLQNTRNEKNKDQTNGKCQERGETSETDPDEVSP